MTWSPYLKKQIYYDSNFGTKFPAYLKIRANYYPKNEKLGANHYSTTANQINFRCGQKEYAKRVNEERVRGIYVIIVIPWLPLTVSVDTYIDACILTISQLHHFLLLLLSYYNIILYTHTHTHNKYIFFFLLPSFTIL
jgi:hypothetical protein